ncbi:M81 family metallopeptidase [Niabella sp.]|uniref:M81 family metallopeptidase n=1 Tax=Niabella sp. TaxID=1962976 RepID=UPI002637F2CE|nr:M81 family metallopeptidase [Niabella sp.]
MKKRVALAGIYHESNTFSKRPTTYADFEKGHLLRGADILVQYKDAHHEIGGLIAALDPHQVELVPLLYAEATPGGTIEKETYERLKNELITLLKEALPLDAVLVTPHGAAVAEGYPDMDGDWLQQVREVVGHTIPIAGTLDPHANVSRRMVQATDALYAYATNPHLDQRETGKKAGSLLQELLFKNKRIKQELLQLPLQISIEQQNTNEEPCRSLYREVQETATDMGALAVSILLGFPYADVYEMGSAVIVISSQETDTGPWIPRLEACFLGRLPSFCGERTTLQQILSQASGLQKPVLLLDMGDNVGGGARGCSMYLLDLLEAAGKDKVCICITSRQTVAAISKFGPGDKFSISFKELDDHNREAPYKVRLMGFRDGAFTEPAPRHGGQAHYDMGKVALLQTEAGNIIVVASLRVPPFSSRQLTSLGIEPEKLEWIIAKGVNAPMAAYKDICPVMIRVNTPGETGADMTAYTFKNRRRPLFPFETIHHEA